jgi:ubiquinone/menaquinone biosynthesis C-methylase UbiE
MRNPPSADGGMSDGSQDSDDGVPQNAVPAQGAADPLSYGEDEHVSMGSRLAAWWNGDIISRHGSNASAGGKDKAVTIDITKWSPDRVKLVQMLWGGSFLEPGGANRTRKLFSHVMPNSKQSVLDLTAGLGGTAFTLAQDQGLWMDALEPDHDLAAEALKAASISGLGGQVPVSHFSIDAIDIPKNKYHLAYTRERLFVVSQKLELLTAAALSLKEGGSLMITDLMVPDPETMDTDAYQEWVRTEPILPQPWTLSLYAKSLEDCGLKVAGRQDLTKDYLDDIHAGWARVTRALQDGEFDRSLGDHLLAEGEFWAGRTKALTSRVAFYCRIIARRIA